MQYRCISAISGRRMGLHITPRTTQGAFILKAVTCNTHPVRAPFLYIPAHVATKLVDFHSAYSFYST